MTSLDMKPYQAGRPMITAMIDDKPVALLVDTAEALSSLTKRTVRELNLQTAAVAHLAHDVSRRKRRISKRACLRLRLAVCATRVRYFMVLPGDEDPVDPPIEVFGGILGSEMLRNVDFDFDFAANKVNLVSQDHCAGNVVYWPAPAVAVVPCTLNAAGHITFRMELDGRRVNAMLDTGASTTVLNLDIARRTFRVDVNAPDVEKVGEIDRGYTANVYRRRFKTLTFEGVTVANPMITMCPDMMSGRDLGRAANGFHHSGRESGLPDVILGMNV